MIRGGVHIFSVRRGRWDEYTAAILQHAGDCERFNGFELLEVNGNSYALVRNVRGCIWLGAYVGRGALEFVLHILRRGFACFFTTRYVRQAQRVFRGLYTDCVEDPDAPGRFGFFIPRSAA